MKTGNKTLTFFIGYWRSLFAVCQKDNLIEKNIYHALFKIFVKINLNIKVNN